MRLLWVVVALEGCAPHRIWTRPHYVEAEFKRDKYDCVQESRTSWYASGSGLGGAIARARARGEANQQADEMFCMCMEARGWHAKEE